MWIESQYVKISQPQKYLHLKEVQVFAIVNGVERNVALSSYGATATQSSDWPVPGPASLAIDGNVGGWGSETNSGDGAPWWEVDLKRSYNVKRIKIWLRTDCCSNRMSYSKVSLLSSSRGIEKEYTLGNTAGKVSIELLIE